MRNAFKGAILAGLAAASVSAAMVGGAMPANAAPSVPIPQDWTKTQCYYWNYTESTAQTCFTERYPGNIPPDWDTPNYTPYKDGAGTVIYGPGAVQWDTSGYRVDNTKPNPVLPATFNVKANPGTVTTATFDINAGKSQLAVRPTRLGI